MGKIQIDCVWLFQIEQGVLELQDIWMKLEFWFSAQMLYSLKQ